MTRPKNVTPSKPLTFMLPAPTLAQLTLHLFSEAENRVPHGAYSRFIGARIDEYFTHRRLDLAPYISAEAGAFIVSGSPEAIAALKQRLEK